MSEEKKEKNQEMQKTVAFLKEDLDEGRREVSEDTLTFNSDDVKNRVLGKKKISSSVENIIEKLGCAEVNRNKKKRKKKNYLARFLGIIAVIIAFILFLASPIFNVDKITVTGNNYYSDSEVIMMSGAVKGNNIIFKPGKKKIINALEKNPYFREVSVKRHLPSTLEINVDERQQIANIKYGNKYVVISESGLVLRIGAIDPKLTLLKGLTLSKMKVGEHVRAEEKLTLKETLSMVALMRKGNLFFKKIHVKDRFIEAYVFDTLIVRGTPDRMKSVIESGHLQKVINKLYKNKMKRGTINLGDHNYISFSPAF